MNALTRYAPLAGRILLALLFLSAGYGKLTGFAGTAGYIASKGLPFPALAAVLAIVIELAGGVMLIAGWNARWAAAAMIVFTAVASLVFHPFWAVPADQLVNQSIHFWKNVSIMGGLLYVLAYGSGPFSIAKARESGFPDNAARAGA